MLDLIAQVPAGLVQGVALWALAGFTFAAVKQQAEALVSRGDE